MNLLLTFFAPIALLVPTMTVGGAAGDAVPAAPQAREPIRAVSPADEPAAGQVRIEQRVIVRISPPGPRVGQSIAAETAPAAVPRLSERKMGKCVPVSGIAAVQPDSSGRLLLFMRDRRLVSATLEKACSARDFYAGFYLERTRDGMLCVDRDRLHSRAGANCEVSRLRQLVAKDD